ncbi:hypothetical protein EB008_00340 [bacterium]|nr:hypothetical protein [bacterium]
MSALAPTISSIDAASSCPRKWSCLVYIKEIEDSIPKDYEDRAIPRLHREYLFGFFSPNR